LVWRISQAVAVVEAAVEAVVGVNASPQKRTLAEDCGTPPLRTVGTEFCDDGCRKQEAAS
jgi:hypothetical protein